MLYALLMYRHRSNAIARSENTRIDDQRGPALLVLLLLTVLALTYAVQLHTLL